MWSGLVVVDEIVWHVWVDAGCSSFGELHEFESMIEACWKKLKLYGRMHFLQDFGSYGWNWTMGFFKTLSPRFKFCGSTLYSRFLISQDPGKFTDISISILYKNQEAIIHRALWSLVVLCIRALLLQGSRRTSYLWHCSISFVALDNISFSLKKIEIKVKKYRDK